MMMVSQLITWTSSLLLTSALGSHLGDKGFGDLYLAMSFAVIFGVLVGFGLDQELTRAVARDRSLLGRYLINSLAIKAALSVVAYGLILGLVQWLGYSPELKLTVAVFSLIMLFQGITSSLGAVYQAFERVFYPTVGVTLERVLICVVGIFLLNRGYGATAVAAAFVAATAVNALWQMLFLRKLGRIDCAIDVRMAPALLRSGLPFFLFWALASVYFRIDTVLLSKMAAAEVVGWYAAAYKLFDTLVFLPSIVSTAIMYPILARLSVQSPSDLRLAMDKGLSVMLMLGAPIATGLFVLAEPIIQFIYRRPEFLPAVPALRWLAVALFLLYVNHMLAIGLWSLNQEKKMTIVAGLAIVVNLGLNLALIPHFQHLGAAAVTVVTELFITGYVLAVMPKGLLSRSSLVVFLKAATASAVMALALYMLRGESLLLLVPVGGLVYGLCGLVVRLVPPEDIRLVRQAIAVRRAPSTAGTEATQA